MKRSRMVLGAGLVAVLALSGCGDGATPAVTSGPAASAGGGGAGSVPLTGNVVEVEMISGNGEIFAPDAITARRGDVIRFKLVTGVHNASFPQDKNPSGVKLPDATPLLQLPGQTHDVTVDLPAGTYHFQCDPHIALGMVGTLTVVD